MSIEITTLTSVRMCLVMTNSDRKDREREGVHMLTDVDTSYVSIMCVRLVAASLRQIAHFPSSIENSASQFSKMQAPSSDRFAGQSFALRQSLKALNWAVGQDGSVARPFIGTWPLES